MKMQPFFHSLVKPVRPVGKALVPPQQHALSSPRTSWGGGNTRGGVTSQQHCLRLSTPTSHGWGPSADPHLLSLGSSLRSNRSAWEAAFGVWDAAFCDVGTARPRYHCWGMLVHYPLSRGGMDRPIQDTQCFWTGCFSHPHEAMIALEIYFYNKLFMTMSELRAGWKLVIQKPFWKGKAYA